ncbi:MAG: ABC transporter permease [Candidatus Saccharimonadaceae bacterium]|nr:ABC transporter permease [Candidatus Saccharimonadaceae bacterium]
MFIHNFKYSLKTLFRNKALIFWTFAFPIILGTFFNMAFSNIESSEKLDIINIAIIKNDDFNNNEIFKTAFEELSDKNNDDRLFETRYTTEEEAKKLLEDEEIVGYMKLVNDEPKLTFTTSGINETIFKYVSEEIAQTSNIIKNLSEEEIKKEMIAGNYNIDYESIYNNVIELTEEDDVRLNNVSNSNLGYTMIEFYTLIAMACLYGGILGAVAINQNLANMTNQGKRVSVSPTSKGKIILSSVLASYITQLVGVALLFLYTIFVLKVDYGNKLGLDIALAMAGSLAGLSLGVAVATTIKSNDNVKTGIIIAITMLGCFLSGMMGITMKYIIDKNIPIINKLNPASMITDGFYSLYYYDTLDRYIFDIGSLLIFAFVLIAISYISLRRQKYDSI